MRILIKKISEIQFLLGSMLIIVSFVGLSFASNSQAQTNCHYSPATNQTRCYNSTTRTYQTYSPTSQKKATCKTYEHGLKKTCYSKSCVNGNCYYRHYSPTNNNSGRLY